MQKLLSIEELIIILPVRMQGADSTLIHRGDSVDNPFPMDANMSRILGRNRKGRSVSIHKIEGTRVQCLKEGRIDNVNVRYGFGLSRKTIDIANTTNRSNNSLMIGDLISLRESCWKNL